MEFGQKNFLVKLVYLISRVFLTWTFSNCLAHCAPWCSLVTCQSKYNRKAIKAIGFFTDSGHTSEVFLVYWNYQGGLKGHKRPRGRWGKVVLFLLRALLDKRCVGFCWLFFSLFWRFNIILLQASQLLWWRDLERGYKPSFHQKLMWGRGGGSIL